MLGAAAALAAVGFLLAMVLWGRAPETRNLVKFEAAGLVAQSPDRIDRVELATDRGRWALTRIGAGQWAMAPSGAAAAAPLASHVELSLRFMHVTAPVRVLSREEYARGHLEEFGLDPPRYTVSLHRGVETVLTARFGGISPQQVLQYVRIDGRDELYLLPSFVGQEWERVARGVAGP
jgi:hypothetical protein